MIFATRNWFTFIGSIWMLSNYGNAKSCYPYLRNSWLLCEHFGGTLQTDEIKDIPEKIRFSKNQLTAIGPSSFSNRFKNITELDLEYNKIGSISADGFKNLTSLEHINLSHNSIKTLSSKTFAANTKLKVIDLTDNQLNVLNFALIRNLEHLEQFLLSRNPLGCDSETKQALEYLEERKIITYFLQNCDNIDGGASIANNWTRNYNDASSNETSDTFLTNKSNLATLKPLIIIFGVMLLLVVVLIVAVVAMFRKIFRKRENSSRRSRTESGNCLLQGSESSENQVLDEDGYLVPVMPAALPEYKEVFYKAFDRPIPAIPLQPNVHMLPPNTRNKQSFRSSVESVASSSDENALNHVYEKVDPRSNYARNLERHLRKPYARVRQMN